MAVASARPYAIICTSLQTNNNASTSSHNNSYSKSIQTRMWANAQHDGRPAKYSWRPLFNAAVWLMPSTGVPSSNAAKTRNPLKLAGVPKLQNWSHLLVGQSSAHCGVIWRRYCCLTSFFPIVDTCLRCEDIADKIVRWCADGNFLHPTFSASRVQHVSDLHPKFALRPYHAWKYGRHPISDRWD